MSVPASIRSSKEFPNTWRASTLDFRGSRKQEVNASTELAIFPTSSAPGPFSFAKVRSLEFALKTQCISHEKARPIQLFK